jgi:outer membrane protein OmpA-like peptidoglycan-associated protein
MHSAKPAEASLSRGLLRGLPFVALLSLMSASGEARAGGCPPLVVPVTTGFPSRAPSSQMFSTCVDGDNLWPHAGGGPFFAVGPTTTTPRGGVSFGIVGSFLSEPIGVRVSSPDPAGSTVFVVDKAFDATVLLALGMTDRLELTLAAPATLYQSGAGLEPISATSVGLLRSAPRDLRFGLSAALLARPRTGEERGPALTGRLEFSAPTGSVDAFARGRTATVVPSIVFAYKISRVELAAEVVARLRGETTFGTAVIGPQVGGAGGFTVDILWDRWLSAGFEMFALRTLSKQLPAPDDTSGAAPPPLVPGEWIAHVSTAHFLAGDLTFSLGGGSSIPFAAHGAFTSPQYRLDFALRYAPTGRDTDGDGVPDRDDRCPTERGPRENGGCPDHDTDGDGIPDSKDKCPDQPGTIADLGCPGLDSDGDGIPDAQDKCPALPEDFDGFQDHDGCPEADNDLDGIPDAQDKCPNDPEDLDGFQDHDGCPDPDDDQDGIPDAQDKCPNDPEDLDGFQDHDGCPEPDNDEDGVPDAIDLCPNTAETLDGFQDADGCPEPGAKPLVRWQDDHIVVSAPAVPFAPGKDTVPPALEKQLRVMAQLAAGRAPLGSVLVEAYADRPGDVSVRALELAVARAGAVKKTLVAAGLPAALITAAAGDPAAKRPAGAPTIDLTVVRRARPSRPKPSGRARGAPGPVNAGATPAPPAAKGPQ